MPQTVGGEAVSGLRLAWWTLASNLFLASIKIAGGLAFSSQAVLADGVHSLSDVAGSSAVLYGRRVAANPPDEEHPYGHEKAESVAAFAVGVILLVAGLTVASEAIGTLLRGAPGVPQLPALGIALLGIGVKEVFYRLSLQAALAADSAGLKANAADSRADVWSSMAAFVGVLLSQFGVRWADPAMALAVSALLVDRGRPWRATTSTTCWRGGPPGSMRGCGGRSARCRVYWNCTGCVRGPWDGSCWSI